MNITLENESLLVTINPTGAELSSVVNRSDQIEYMWQADPQVWKRHAPVLFPIVGRLKDNQYKLEGHTYQMNQHGFARDQAFNILSKSTQACTFELIANEDTKAIYPFEFTLQIGYELNENQLTVSYLVINNNTQEMPFSIGAHPGFRCPLVPGEQLTDYVVEFELPEQAETHLLKAGLFDHSTRPVLNNEQQIAITPHTFDDDALVFHHLQSSFVSLKSIVSGRNVTVGIKGFPYLGIWAQPGAAFVCIEPWLGLADYVDSTGNLIEKKGIHILSPDESFGRAYNITFA